MQWHSAVPLGARSIPRESSGETPGRTQGSRNPGMMRQFSRSSGAVGMAEVPVVRMDGPVLVFGGPYSNLEATLAVLAEARRRAIPRERVVCTGDIVAYAADAVATTAAVREAGVWAVLGNCDDSLAAGAEDCGCGYAEGSACDRLASEWYAHAHRTLDAESRRWMGALPRRLTLEIGGRRLAGSPGAGRSHHPFAFASSPA